MEVAFLYFYRPKFSLECVCVCQRRHESETSLRFVTQSQPPTHSPHQLASLVWSAGVARRHTHKYARRDRQCKQTRFSFGRVIDFVPYISVSIIHEQWHLDNKQ
ncbi:hypothetical protein ILYODFUR_003783 [Ilyodon furcidens]|uniref:Uncharacterized protein n=1 Tax=Ilyodon furcidens TaxID=33524 RepID=A0ABV0U2G7_9TELE